MAGNTPLALKTAIVRRRPASLTATHNCLRTWQVPEQCQREMARVKTNESGVPSGFSPSVVALVTRPPMPARGTIPASLLWMKAMDTGARSQTQGRMPVVR
jgi:hypothetical protein